MIVLPVAYSLRSYYSSNWIFFKKLFFFQLHFLDVPLEDFLQKVPNAELEPFIELLNFGSANYKFNFCNTLA